MTTMKTPPAMRMTASAFSTAKVDQYGNPTHRIEDCHFIYGGPKGDAPTVIGVADGVGGYKDSGIDPGEYSEELMLQALAAVYLADSSSSTDVDPIKILKTAHSQTKKPGGSTACVIALVGDQLRFANVGDSGFKVFRGNSVAYQSPIQQLGYNYPAQLSKGDRRHLNGAAEGSVILEAGDVVVVGTDGLFDNLYTEEIERILEERMDWEVQDLAQRIALTAFENSVDVKYCSPFQLESMRHGKQFVGGKRDDITAVVCRIHSLPGFTGQTS